MKRLLVLLCATVLALAACTGGSGAVDQTAGGQFRFVAGTPQGKTIAIAKRKTAGTFTGTLLDGKTFVSTSDAGKVMVINFWATWCGPCQTETPNFNKVYLATKASGVDFVGVAVKNPPISQPRAFVSDNSIAYPNIYDENGAIGQDLGKVPLQGLPATVVLDRHQKVAAVYIGPILPAALTPVVTSLAAES